MQKSSIQDEKLSCSYRQNAAKHGKHKFSIKFYLRIIVLKMDWILIVLTNSRSNFIWQGFFLFFYKKINDWCFSKKQVAKALYTVYFWSNEFSSRKLCISIIYWYSCISNKAWFLHYICCQQYVFKDNKI